MSDDYLLAIKHGSNWSVLAPGCSGIGIMARPSESEGVVSVGIMDKFKNFIGIPEDEYYDDEDVDFISSDNGRGDMREDPPSHSEKRGNKVVNIHATTQLQVVLVKPERSRTPRRCRSSQRQAHGRVES